MQTQSDDAPSTSAQHLHEQASCRPHPPAACEAPAASWALAAVAAGLRLGHRRLSADARERQRRLARRLRLWADAQVDGAKLAATLRPGGVAVQLGIPGAGLTCALPVLETAFLELKFVGSNTGGRATTAEMLQFAAKKGIAPRVETMPMKDVNNAIQRINAGEAHYRIVLVNE